MKAIVVGSWKLLSNHQFRNTGPIYLHPTLGALCSPRPGAWRQDLQRLAYGLGWVQDLGLSVSGVRVYGWEFKTLGFSVRGLGLSVYVLGYGTLWFMV